MPVFVVDRPGARSAEPHGGSVDTSVWARRRGIRVPRDGPGSVGRALDVQRLLASRSMTRSVGIPDLLIAAVGELHRVTVLHYDTDIEHVAAVTGQAAEWAVPRGAAT